jgi:hypothetical protein
MLSVFDNPVWCRAIFKHLLTNPELIQKFSFRSEYFNKELERLFDVVHSYLNKNEGTVYSLNVIYAAYFDYIMPDLRPIYYADDKTIYGQDQLDKLTHILTTLRSLYDAIEESYSTLSPIFIEEKLKELVQQAVITKRLLEQQTAYLILNKDCESTDDFVNKMAIEYDRIERTYAMPDVQSDIYLDVFDNRLRVEIDDSTFPSMISPLNEYLVGGFRKQAVYGFLTKTGAGKSTLLITLASDALRQGHNICYVNLEMNNHEVSSNIMSALSEKKTYKDILHNLTNDAFMDDLKNEIGAYTTNHFTIINNSSDVKCDFKWLKKKVKSVEKELSKKTNTDYKFDFIMIDYLYLMETVRSLYKNSRTDEMYRQLAIEMHKFCQEENYCGITVFQGNRGAEAKINAGERITLADGADSYGAFRDIDYAFSIQRDKERDGILIDRLKSRQYDGTKNEMIFVPYSSFGRKYESMLAEFVEIEDDVQAVKRGRPVGSRNRQYEIEVKDVLEADRSLIRNMPLGTIMGVCNESEKVKNTTFDKLKSICAENGWSYMTKDDFQNPDYAAMRNQVKRAIDLALHKNETPGRVIMSNDINISGKDLFE